MAENMAKSNLTTPYNVQLQCTHCAAPVIGVHPSAVHLHRDGVQRLWITDGIGSLFTVAHAPSTKPNLAHHKRRRPDPKTDSQIPLMGFGTETHPHDIDGLGNRSAPTGTKEKTNNYVFLQEDRETCEAKLRNYLLIGARIFRVLSLCTFLCVMADKSK